MLSLSALAVAAGMVAPSAAEAAGCPAPACIVISGTVAGPLGEAVPEYRVLVQRSDGYNVTVLTNGAGQYAAEVPVPSPSVCYQIVGQADAYYTNSTTGQKQCASGVVDLRPKIRIQSVVGQQKIFIASTNATTTIPIEISALSRRYPAAFDGQALPWVIEHHDPSASHSHIAPNADEHFHVHDHSLHHGQTGVFVPPSVRTIAPGVWQYRWNAAMTLPTNAPGYYDMDWGRGASVFDPMMECKMVWFGYGLTQVAPAQTLPGSTVTASGIRLGVVPGKLVLRSAGQVTTIEGNAILSWSDTSVTFVVPPLAKSGWIAAVTPARVISNAQYLALETLRIPA